VHSEFRMSIRHANGAPHDEGHVIARSGETRACRSECRFECKWWHAGREEET